jgi:hypothetical protein
MPAAFWIVAAVLTGLFIVSLSVLHRWKEFHHGYYGIIAMILPHMSFVAVIVVLALAAVVLYDWKSWAPMAGLLSAMYLLSVLPVEVQMLAGLLTLLDEDVQHVYQAICKVLKHPIPGDFTPLHRVGAYFLLNSSI